jgi:WhiB family transcriptional regulator, redox-sensing transcriptional regulator
MADAVARSTRWRNRSQRGELAELAAPGWQLGALCAQADPEAWFPKPGAVARPQVFTICAVCPIRRRCLAAGLLYREHGVWGGTTEADRLVLYRLLRAGVSVAVVLDFALSAPRRTFQVLVEALGTPALEEQEADAA